MSDTDDIIRISRELERIDEKILDFEEALPLPDELRKPLYVPIRGGYFADNAVTDELAARKKLHEEHKAEGKARKQRKQQLIEMKRVLKKQLKRLLLDSRGQSVNSGDSRVILKQIPRFGKKRHVLPSEKRARTVARIIDELNILKPPKVPGIRRIARLEGFGRSHLHRCGHFCSFRRAVGLQGASGQGLFAERAV